MLFISPNFDVKLIFFPMLARGLFPKLLKKALIIWRAERYLKKVRSKKVYMHVIVFLRIYSNRYKTVCKTNLRVKVLFMLLEGALFFRLMKELSFICTIVLSVTQFRNNLHIMV